MTIVHKITISEVNNGFIVVLEYLDNKAITSGITVETYLANTRKELHACIDKCLKEGLKCPLST